jgi:hypothetical protein
MNALTTRESTAFYTRLPVDQLDFGIQLLAGCGEPARLPPLEVDAERGDPRRDLDERGRPDDVP